MNHSDGLNARLNDIVDQVIASFGEREVTTREVAQRALSPARSVCEPRFDEFVSRMLRPLIRRRLGSFSTRAQPAQGVFALFGGVGLPGRIAVPTSAKGDEGSEDTKWVVLHRATVAQVELNVQMRDLLITGAQAERDKIYAVLMAAKDAGAKPGDIIGDIRFA